MLIICQQRPTISCYIRTCQRLDMDNEAELDTVVRGRARKRKVNAANWKRRSAKVARNTEKAYVPQDILLCFVQ